VNAWTGLFAPKGTPREIILRVNEAVNQVSADPAIRERIIKGGDEPGGGTPEHLAEIVRRDYAMWGEVVRANNIRAD
jgi:tripartite-type tricarboxylate transporter receptor subunit TctC